MTFMRRHDPEKDAEKPAALSETPVAEMPMRRRA
jgi:hypothetical protein